MQATTVATAQRRTERRDDIHPTTRLTIVKSTGDRCSRYSSLLGGESTRCRRWTR